jgi:hypothetical protein
VGLPTGRERPYVAFRLAFSTVDNALGAEPDRQLAESAPPGVREAVDFGRRPAAFPSGTA